MKEEFAEIYESYVNGQIKQMVKQMDRILLSDLISHLQDLLDDSTILAMLKKYYLLKERQDMREQITKIIF